MCLPTLDGAGESADLVLELFDGFGVHHGKYGRVLIFGMVQELHLEVLFVRGRHIIVAPTQILARDLRHVHPPLINPGGGTSLIPHPYLP